MKIIKGHKTSDGYPAWRLGCDSGWMEGCIVDGVIYIWAVISNKKGTFKNMMNAITKEFNISKIKFTMVISDKLRATLKGFKETKEYFKEMGEYVPCLVGDWRNE